MNIELNKCYRTRDGKKATSVYLSTEREQDNFLMTDGIKSWWAYDTGSYFSREGDSKDLVSEWVDKPEMDRSVLPAWANKAVAMDRDGEWFCFSDIPHVKYVFWSSDETCARIPDSYAPKWSGDWKDSLLVFKD